MGAQLPGARLVLAGVANALDLTERALPLLAALGARPRLLPFPAYDAGQLQALLAQRLAALPGPAFQAQALRLCAKKVRRWLPCFALEAAPSHRHKIYPVHMPGNGAQQRHALRAAFSPMPKTLDHPDSRARWQRAAGTCAARWRQPQIIDTDFPMHVPGGGAQRRHAPRAGGVRERAGPAAARGRRAHAPPSKRAAVSDGTCCALKTLYRPRKAENFAMRSTACTTTQQD